MKIAIPGHADYDLKYVVCDYNGTLAIDGILIDGIGDLFNSLSQQGLRLFEMLNAADILVKDIRDGLSLILSPKRLIASLRL